MQIHISRGLLEFLPRRRPLVLLYSFCPWLVAAPGLPANENSTKTGGVSEEKWGRAAAAAAVARMGLAG